MNIEATGVFAVNMPRVADAEAVNLTSTRLDPEQDEFDHAAVPAEECRLIDAPRVAQAPICLECRHLQTVALPSVRADGANALVLGQVLGIHIADEAIRSGRLDYAVTQPLMRLGYRDWCGPGEVFELAPPRGGAEVIINGRKKTC